MSVLQPCYDTKDTLDLFRPQGLYLKPVSRLNVSVQLPQLKKSGAKISNWEVMEKVKEMAKPFAFPVFKVSRTWIRYFGDGCHFLHFRSPNLRWSLSDSRLKLKTTVRWIKSWPSWT